MTMEVWKYVAKNIKEKILTTHVEVVRISPCAPDRTRTYTSQNTRS